MKQVLKRPEWISVYFHENIKNKVHRDNCPSCGTAYTAMEAYVDLIHESEANES